MANSVTLSQFVAGLAGAGVIGTGTVTFFYDALVEGVAKKVVKDLKGDSGELHAISERWTVRIEPMVKKHEYLTQGCKEGDRPREQCRLLGLETRRGHSSVLLMPSTLEELAERDAMLPPTGGE